MKKKPWKRIQATASIMAIGSFAVGLLAAACESFFPAYIMAITFLLSLLVFAGGRIGEAATED